MILPGARFTSGSWPTVAEKRTFGAQFVQLRDCGMMTFQNEDLTAKIQEDLGVDASGSDDVRRIGDSDVHTGYLQEVIRG